MIEPEFMEIVARGNYEAQHYVDFSGDGWSPRHVPSLRITIVTSKRPRSR